MKQIPKIASAVPVDPATLLVTFDNGARKRYDCAPLLSRPEFGMLRAPAFFRAVRVDPGSYGVSWNDEIDLSEYELWTNGAPVENGPLEPAA